MASPFDLPVVRVVGDSYNFNSAPLEFLEGQLIHYFRAVNPAIQFTPRAKLPLSPLRRIPVSHTVSIIRPYDIPSYQYAGKYTSFYSAEFNAPYER